MSLQYFPVLSCWPYLWLQTSSSNSDSPDWQWLFSHRQHQPWGQIKLGLRSPWERQMLSLKKEITLQLWSIMIRKDEISDLTYIILLFNYEIWRLWPPDQAVELDPGEVTYPANRANVYLKLNKWAEAEKDCTDAVKLDPKASKVSREWEGQKDMIHQYFLIRHLIGVAKQGCNYRNIRRL